ncbi:tRNA pseudouridine(38/39) synthase [Anabrus simplex]|uniref:tRNA pseudouridine(38/39) synthase n=1 Tax=Anabrus simplex TaxID=316456 RepID=UPI0035A2B1A1
MDGNKKEKKKKSVSTREELMALSKEELIEQVLKLEAYNFQLKNVLNKQLSGAGADADQKEKDKKQRAFDFSKCTRRHVALRLLYLGWDYHGLSAQEWTHQTVEHRLFAALTKSCLIESRQTSNYHRCGRTDKGVSAFCQVISIDLRSSLTQEQIDAGMTAGEMPYAKILNRLLPEDMRVLSWRPVPSDFSARFDCTSRTYKYFFPRGNLDIALMNEAVQYVVGTHDFRNLCKLDVKNGVTNYVRSVSSADVRVSCTDPEGDLSYDMCELTLSGKAFLWHQVRCIMGILLLVGGGYEHPDVVKELLEVEERPHKPQYNLASELPLNLFHCDYEGSSRAEVVDEEAQREVVQTLQRKWAEHAVRARMVRSMLSDLPAATAQSNWLLQGVKPKLYCPLLLRPTCDSVEGRIQHFAKKRRIEMSDDSAGDADTKTLEAEEGDE